MEPLEQLRAAFAVDPPTPLLEPHRQFTAFVFRTTKLAPGGDTHVTVAPVELVTSFYGGGGPHGTAGVAAAFGGAIVCRSEDKTELLIGVWGARNASRFRSALRASGASLRILKDPPPARILSWTTTSLRSSPSQAKP